MLSFDLNISITMPGLLYAERLDAAEVLDVAVREAPGEVAGLVEAPAGDEGIGEEALGGGGILGDDGLRVSTAVGVDVDDSLFQAVHDLHGEDRIAVLRVPVFIGSGLHVGCKGLRESTATKFRSSLTQVRHDQRQNA